jgi:hypothetical protein
MFQFVSVPNVAGWGVLAVVLRRLFSLKKILVLPRLAASSHSAPCIA